MRDALDIAERWPDRQIAVATVVGVRGSAPRPPGSRFFVAADGAMAGSVSSGCVENDVAVRAGRVLDRGTPELVEYGIADDEAFEVGLTCGGTIDVFIDRLPSAVLDAVGHLVAAEDSGAVVTLLEGPGAGSVAVVDAEGNHLGGDTSIADAVRPSVRKLIAIEAARMVDSGRGRVFVEPVVPQPVLLVFGAGHVAQPLVGFARELGYRTVVADARGAWATDERFPDVDGLVVDWPAAVLDRHPLDDRTSVVLLSHDARFEDPVLEAVRDAPVRYVGVMGSRRTHAQRVERLRDAGWTDEEIGRIHGPVGLDLGGRSPAEVALSILAEVTAVRYGRDPGRSLADGSGPIH